MLSKSLLKLYQLIFLSPVLFATFEKVLKVHVEPNVSYRIDTAVGWKICHVLNLSFVKLIIHDIFKTFDTKAKMLTGL